MSQENLTMLVIFVVLTLAWFGLMTLANVAANFQFKKIVWVARGIKRMLQYFFMRYLGASEQQAYRAVLQK